MAQTGGIMKGIVLAAGKGTRLYPMTKPVCKPLLPVYDKPLIYYPIAILMQSGISDILVIVPPHETDTFSALLGDGSQYGLHISYAEQPVARGIADALLIGQEFVGGDNVCLVLGDNIFHAPTLASTLKRAASNQSGATVFGYWVEDPRPFGVVEFDQEGKAISIEEKPRYPKSNYIIPGLYFYDHQVMEIARNLKPSARGELEITDVNLEYLRRGQLHVIPLEKNFTWLDAGTADSLLEAGQTIRQIQDTTGRYVGCLEELALYEGWVTEEQVHAIGDELSMTLYGKYLQCL
jgi:glucose-1-phosphate thymidylyltransferase